MPSPSGSSAYVRSSLTNDPLVNSLLFGTEWASNSISFSFPLAAGSAYWSTDPVSGYGPYKAGASEPWSTNYSALSISDMNAVRTALASWANVTNLTFNEVADNSSVVGDLRFAYSDTSGGQAWAYNPYSAPKAGDVWFNALGTSAFTQWTPGSYEYLTVLHEIGHALGLKHSFESSPSNAQTMPSDLDARMYTVMSYSAYPDTETKFSYEPTTPMVLDMAAIQSLYGANTSYNSGNTNYVFSGSSIYNQTIWDAGGLDTFIYNSSTGGTINLTAGVAGGSLMGSPVYIEDLYGNRLYQFYSINIANGVVIENATGGSGHDVITGNAASNVLIGGLGNDRLDGRAGIDTASYAGTAVGVAVNLGLTSAQNTVGAGTDTLIGIENLMGSSFNDTLMGNAGNNVLNGGAGIDNVSYAGSSAGVTVNLSSTSAQSTGGAGMDTLLGFENLIGSRFNDTLTGNAGNNGLNGGPGNDSINGGAGVDTASYAGAASGVTVNLGLTSAQNTFGAGTDTIMGIEHLMGSSFNDKFVGSASNNVLNGGLGNDGLSGEAGNDILIGGSGNDTLTGGAGFDYFLFNTPLSATTNRDLITDFNVADDVIQLENSVMASIGLTAGTLAASEFYIGAAAHDADDSIIYNKGTGALYYDVDGTGVNAAVQIATIGTSTHASLTNADFWVV